MNTLMKWKDCVGAGWYSIVNEAVVAIEKHGGFIFQIKEKFGGLRIYTHGGDADAIDDIVREAERKASYVCEECGQPGRMESSPTGWYKTYCEKHHLDRESTW